MAMGAPTPPTWAQTQWSVSKMDRFIRQVNRKEAEAVAATVAAAARKRTGNARLAAAGPIAGQR